jgi:hypothetical protein
MDELEKLIEKWDEQIALHRRVCDDPIKKNYIYTQSL